MDVGTGAVVGVGTGAGEPELLTSGRKIVPPPAGALPSSETPKIKLDTHKKTDLMLPPNFSIL
jgi:hypothetical protein